MLQARFVDAADRSGNHTRCPLLDIARDPQVIRWARREDEEVGWRNRSAGR
jgi:hypothetical protein